MNQRSSHHLKVVVFRADLFDDMPEEEGTPMTDGRRLPETCRDLERMIETSHSWFDGQITCERLVADDEPYPVGCVYENVTRVSAHPYNGTVAVSNHDVVVAKVHDNGSWSSTYDTKWIREMTFEEFRNSEFWDTSMEAFVDGDADASAFDEFDADCDGADGFISFEMERQYTDWLGNHRVAKDHDRFECHADIAGWLTLKCGNRTYDGDARELFDLIGEALAFRNRGIKLDGDMLRVTVPKREPEDEK